MLESILWIITSFIRHVPENCCVGISSEMHSSFALELWIGLMDTLNIFSWHEDYYQYVPLWQPPGDAGQVWPTGTAVSGPGSGTCMSLATSEYCIGVSAVASEYFPICRQLLLNIIQICQLLLLKILFSRYVCSCFWIFSRYVCTCFWIFSRYVSSCFGNLSRYVSSGCWILTWYFSSCSWICIVQIRLPLFNI